MTQQNILNMLFLAFEDLELMHVQQKLKTYNISAISLHNEELQKCFSGTVIPAPQKIVPNFGAEF